MRFVEELTWRGLVHQVSEPALAERESKEPLTLYAGFDPTADSLHVGSLLPILALRRAQLAGHRPIALVGGATGMVGDPSGKSEERKLLDLETVARNAAAIGRQLERFLDFGSGADGARLANNGDWFAGLGYLEFLRDIGKHFSVGMMLSKDSVRSRLEGRDQGLSYTEFSYMLIQAYDFLWLHDHHGCRLQLGGSDQWGNITAGIDLVRRLRQAEVFGLTMPLITTSSGQKFGKTERGTVWLDAARTPPYDLYQFFVQTDDRDVGRCLRYYTFLDAARISELDETLRVAPEKREAHRVLAYEVTRLVHGAVEADQARDAALALFTGRGATAGSAPSWAPSSDIARGELAGEAGAPLVDWLVRTGLCSSKGAARRDVEQGGIYVNEERVGDVARHLTAADVRDGVIMLRRGKRNHHVLRVVDP